MFIIIYNISFCAGWRSASNELTLVENERKDGRAVKTRYVKLSEYLYAMQGDREKKDEDMDIDNRSTKATQVGYACTSKHTQREKSGRGR